MLEGKSVDKRALALTKAFKKSNPKWAEFFKIKDEWVSLFVPLKEENYKVGG